jgi:hypothetical protein
VTGNEAVDDVEVEQNDVWGDITVRDNIAEDDVDIEGSCMLGHGKIRVKDNEGGTGNPTGGVETQDNGADCSDGEPEDIKVSGNIGSGQMRNSRNQVLHNFVVKANSTEAGVFPPGVGAAFGFEENVVGNDFKIEGNSITTSGDFLIDQNGVGDDLKIEENATASGTIDVKNNPVDDDLECSDNDPDPTTSGNTVGGTEDCFD